MKMITKILCSALLACTLCLNTTIMHAAQNNQKDADIEVVEVINKDKNYVDVKIKVENKTFTSDEFKKMSITAETKDGLTFYQEGKKEVVNADTFYWLVTLPKDNDYIISTDGVTGSNAAISTTLSTKEQLVDKTALKKALKKAKAIDTSKYTKDTVLNLKSAITYGDKIDKDKNATQKQVDDATTKLIKAISQLKKLGTDGNQQDSNTDGNQKGDKPNTGINENILPYLFIVIAAGGVLIYLRRKNEAK